MPKKYDDSILEQAYELIAYKGYSANKASKELNIDNGTMRKRLKEKYGQIFLPDGKKKINSSFFNEINTEEKAYWLGFLTADGYVSNKNDIELALKESDKEHIKAFKEAIDSQHKISKKKAVLQGKEFYSYRINIRDAEISNDLKKYGLNNNKSYNAFIPIEKIPKDLIRHYIRGIFDGDGSIYSIPNGYNISIISGSGQMSKDLIYITNKHLGFKLKPKMSRNLYEVRLFDQFKVKTFLDWLYKDCSICLHRKHSIYCRFKSKLQKA